ncbi:SURF1 family protein [Gymnodinialimonas sp. 57CJ19]|uniref:SURF1 family protein n=1 Tax=Gymnodinialimonas sp. 57CJ19 TaxID=3138498 RepID=UPI00313446AB
MSRVISVVIFGLMGAAFLSALGVWQLQRLAWKESVLAEIADRIEAAPVDLPEQVDPAADRYLPVVVEGRFEGDAVRVLVSVQGSGPGYRVISAFEAEGRRVMVDRGFVSESVDLPEAPQGTVTVIGNLHWPNEVDGFTPEADLDRNIWYARDVGALATQLQTEPVFIVARELSATDAPLTPLPVTADGIPNNHLGYAIQWFGLALVWLGMTAFLLWRITRRSV